MKKKHEKDIMHFENMRSLIEWAGEEYRDRIAYSYKKEPHDKETVRVSFGEFRGDVRGLTAGLIAMGGAGKRFGVIGKFSYDFAITYFSVLSSGGILVPLDKEWNTEDLTAACEKARIDYLFCDEDISDKARAIAREIKLSRAPVYMLTKDEGNTVSAMKHLGGKLFLEDPSPYYSTPIDPLSMALLVFTSGTTGKGKGVMLSQDAIIRDIGAALPYIDYSDKTVGVLPPHHTYGSTIMFVGHAMIGAEIYVSAGLKYIVKELKEQSPGHLVLVPLYLETFYRRILATVKEQGKEKLLFRMIRISNFLRKIGIDLRRRLFGSVTAPFGGRVKTVISGGAPINPDILDFFDSVGICTLNGYGITECAPLIAVNHSGAVVGGSVGKVIDIDTVKINEPNEEGEGEILVTGPNLMLGYYEDPEATADAIDKDGYFRTGDYGRLDKNGILYITGRKKNLIILSNGKNVYPEEIENELIAAPGILEIIVYEGQSRRGLEHNAIVAEIYPDEEHFKKNGITDPSDYLKGIIDQYNKDAVVYKKIQKIRIRKDPFPKNTLRKIKRFELDMTID